jgi:hypothetical protein
MTKMLKIRAHHLLCIPRFYSGGYNKEFADNMKKVCLLIRKNPGIKIKVISGKPDALCLKCPYKKGDICIQSPEIGKYVVELDKKVLNYLKLKKNSIHKAQDVFNLSMDKIKSAKFCKNCIFTKDCIHVGINNSFRRDLNK